MYFNNSVNVQQNQFKISFLYNLKKNLNKYNFYIKYKIYEKNNIKYILMIKEYLLYIFIHIIIFL